MKVSEEKMLKAFLWTVQS